MHQRDSSLADRLTDANAVLAIAVDRLQVTKSTQDHRELLLHRLASHGNEVRVRNRVTTLVKPRADILGVLALVDPDNEATDSAISPSDTAALCSARSCPISEALPKSSSTSAATLSTISLAARMTTVPKPDPRPWVMTCVGRTTSWWCTVRGGADSTLTEAAGRAMKSLRLNCLQARHAGTVVVLVDGRPEPRALHQAISERLSNSTCTIGIGSRCETPVDFPSPSPRPDAHSTSG
jgi:hypothetical protein